MVRLTMITAILLLVSGLFSATVGGFVTREGSD